MKITTITDLLLIHEDTWGMQGGFYETLPPGI